MNNFIRYKFLSLLILVAIGNLSAQEGFGTVTPNKATIIDAQSTSKGVMVPQIALIGLTSFSPLSGGIGFDTQTANSMLVYNTATTVDITPGYYFWSQTNATNGKWNRLLVSSGPTSNVLTGNVTGSFAANTVSYFKNDNTGMPISLPAPTNAQVISWNGSSWVATTLSGTPVTSQTLTATELNIANNADALLQPIIMAIKPQAVVPAKLNSGTSTDGQVYTANGTGGVIITDASANGFAGRFNNSYLTGSLIPANPLYLTQDTNRSYTGATISVPPGKYMVYMGSSVFSRDGTNSSNLAPNSGATGQGLYVYYYIGDSVDPGSDTDNYTLDFSPGYTGKRAGSAIIAAGSTKAFVSGFVAIENKSGTTKTYYIHSGVRRSTSISSDALLTVAGAFYSGTAAPVVDERYLIAVAIQ